MKHCYGIFLFLLCTIALPIFPQNYSDSSIKYPVYQPKVGIQRPDYRHHLNIPEYAPSLMPLKTVRTGTGIWTELNPKLPRVNYWGVYFINKDTGFAVGEKGAIIKTTNGGEKWYTIEMLYNKTIRTIGSFSGEKIIAAGDSGLIILSRDNGETWQTIQSGTNQDLWNVQIINNDLGWIVGLNSTLLNTTDGGNTWQIKTTPLQGYHFFDVSFIDSSFGYIACFGGLILRTQDGGINWDIRQTGDQYSLTAITAVTRQKAVSLGFAGKQVYTSNGGETWEFIGYLGSTFGKMFFLDTLKGFAVGSGGSFETTNGGRNWDLRIDIKDGNNIIFANDDIGYLVGNGLILEKTTNSGQSWNRTIINDSFPDVFFVHDNKGWFIGNQRLYQTTDGGETLITRDDFPGSRPSSVYFLDSLTGIIGAQQKIYKTYNSGNTWEEKNISGIAGNANEFFRIFFINDNIGWALSYGFVVKTTDRGETWQAQLNAGGLTGIHFSDSLHGWVTREYGGLAKPFKTSNGGETWIEQSNLPLNFTYDVFFKDSLNGFITQLNKLNKTTDGGLNWILISNVTAGLGRFSNKDSNNIFLAGGRTYLSTDAGNSWNEVLEIRDKGITDIHLINKNKRYAVGSIGLVIKYYDEIIPVELGYFFATIKNDHEITLQWSTQTELNNLGFYVQRSVNNETNIEKNWETLGFIQGKGTTVGTNNYIFKDEVLSACKYYYRFKQIDFDGTTSYSDVIEINILSPSECKLKQNYPNPFNAVTKIAFQLPEISIVKLTVYNVLGESLIELVNKKLDTGYYEYEFNGAQYSSGTYIYILQTENYMLSRKMILLK